MKLFEALSEIAVKETKEGVLKRLISGPIVKARGKFQAATLWFGEKSEDETIEKLKASSFIGPEK